MMAGERIHRRTGASASPYDAGAAMTPDVAGHAPGAGDREDAFDREGDREGASAIRTHGAAPIAPGRGEMVGLALQIDAMTARPDEMGLDPVAYLLGVALAELGDRLGERRPQAREKPSGGEAGNDTANDDAKGETAA